ncbi:hypothetical protein B0H19DRAFT_172735 [Mycena capillaripes]|nr:hypothetical protein B0H19DRAFT_172735 [Mycena capillaripes]
MRPSDFDRDAGNGSAGSALVNLSATMATWGLSNTCADDQEEPPFLGVIGFAGCRNSPDSDDEDISTEDGESSGHSLNDTTDTDAGYRNSPDSDDEDISTEDNESSSDSPHDTTDIEDEIAVDTDTGEGESCGESDQETDTDSSEMDSEDSESNTGEDESSGESDQETDTDSSDTDSEDLEEEKEALGRPFHKYNFMR